jgi:hypothetical protein
VIAAQGWRNPIVVSNRSGLITKGHARREAALSLKCATVPVDYQDYATESEELADMIADNRIAELAEADRSMLRDLAEQLDDGAFDTDLTGFDRLALEELMTAAPPENGENNPEEVWRNLPDCANDNQLGIYVIIRFVSFEDKIAFSSVVNQRISDDTKAIWFPKREQDQLGTKSGARYIQS